MKLGKLTILFILIFISLSGNDELENQYKFANQLFNDAKYYEAITEFKRLHFFDNENKYSFEVNYKIGIAYKYGGYYQNAIEHLSKAKIESKTAEEDIESTFQIIRVNILRRTTERALQLLNQSENDSIFENHKEEINYWRGWSYMLADSWDLAAQSFSQISEDHELKTLCEQVNNDKYSVTFATVISYILPGAGQFYTGNYFSGFMSLAWNVLWGYLTINSFMEERVFDGAAIGSLLWLRFYRGNIQNAGKLAQAENIEIANKALYYLMENYKGEKP